MAILGLDKVAHFFGAYVFADAAMALGLPFPWALAFGVAACLAKEAVDKWIRQKVWDWVDLFFGGLGLLGWVCLH